MKKMIMAIILGLSLMAASCFSWIFANSDIQCLLFAIFSLFPYPLFEEGRKEYKAKHHAGLRR